MDIAVIFNDSQAHRILRDALNDPDTRKVSISLETGEYGTHIKVKVNEFMWTPPLSGDFDGVQS